MPVKDAAGEHKPWKNDEKVVGFYARSAEVHYFPNGLEKIFPNLRLIAIAMSKLREIRQSNLMPFDQLQFLCLFDNKIETIDKHLFAYNLMLEAIDLRENRIVKINLNVFDYLINLRILHMSDAFNGSCVSSDANDRDAVVRLIKEIKEECSERAIWRLIQSEKGAAKSIQPIVTIPPVIVKEEKEVIGSVVQQQEKVEKVEEVEEEVVADGVGKLRVELLVILVWFVAVGLVSY